MRDLNLLLKKKHVQFSGSPRTFLIQKYSTMTAVGESDSSLAAKCLDICQVLAGQGLAFNFSLSIGSTFSFSLDARGKGQALATQGKTTKKKKKTLSTLRRNARRRSEFLKKKKWTILESPRAPLVGVLKGPARTIRKEFSSVTDA